MSRKLTQRSRYSKSLDSVRSSSELHHEYVFHKCEAKLLLQKKVKNGEICSQAGADEVIKKIGKIRSFRICLLLTEEMIRIKFLQSPFTRTAILYSQIEGIYSAEKEGNILIIGNRSRKDNVRAYECIRVKNQEDYVKLRELLLEACHSPDRKLPKQLCIGTLQIGPKTSHSRRGSIGSLIWEKPNFDESEPSEVRSVGVCSDDQVDSNNKSTLIPNGSTLFNRIDYTSVLNNKSTEKSTDYNESIHTSVSIDDLDNISPSKISRLFESIEANSSENALIHSEISPNKSEKLLLTTNGLSENWSKGVIFIDPNNSRGTMVNEEGPVYMYCETIPFVPPT